VNLVLRNATTDDEQFLFDVYASTREEELDGSGWDEDQKLMFIRMQFLARERSYPRGGNQIIILNERPIGRMLVERSDSVILLRDIALLTEYRNRGLGTRLIQDLIKEATVSGKAIQLHVLFTSAAVHLYERLGFRKTSEDAAYFEMRWVPGASD